MPAVDVVETRSGAGNARTAVQDRAIGRAHRAGLGSLRRDARVDKAAVAGAARDQTRVGGPLLGTRRGATTCPRSSAAQASGKATANSGASASVTRAAVDASPRAHRATRGGSAPAAVTRGSSVVGAAQARPAAP